MNGADTYHNKAGLKALLVSVPLLWYLGRERSFDFFDYCFDDCFCRDHAD
jgi:hypothetical protein